MKSKLLLSTALLLVFSNAFAQTSSIRGKVTDPNGRVVFATVGIPQLGVGVSTDTSGFYELQNIPQGTHLLKASAVGSVSFQNAVIVSDKHMEFNITLESTDNSLNEVVVTGTMKEVSRLESPVPVEVFLPSYFQKNPTPNLLDATAMINGVQPSLNCNVCNTGDIHINGMEGPYTLILIDGMPIVSALSTVYGLSGIPNSLVERLEVVKGPASSLYGSEAMGGIINVITKNPSNAPRFSMDLFGTTWGEVSVDAALKIGSKKATGLLGVNYFNFQNPIDNNKDGFTDMTLQNRVSVFNKWNFSRKENRMANIAMRYVYENRWGGEMNYSKLFRGSDSIYGESIYTHRAELIAQYQLPIKEKIITQLSYNYHNQNSYYGIVSYQAQQQVAFAQLFWDKTFGKKRPHSLLLGTSFRYTFYDDNTPATASTIGKTQPQHTPLPGAYIQDEWTINTMNKLLVGYRFDYDLNHGAIHSPRVAYKLSPNKNHTIRASFGTGYRVVNLFTEDHAALTGSREVVLAAKLNPEQSYNGNLNYVLKIPAKTFFIGFDITGFYSYFTNKIVGDFATDPNKIIYNNLKGHAVSRGVSLNADASFYFPLKLMVGITFMDVYLMQDSGTGKLIKSQQMHAPKWSGNFAASYTLPKGFSLDFTGKWNGPMRLPILPNDYRPEYSPWFCIANIQLTKKFNFGLEVYAGVKNIFNFVPKDPLMRPFDPFDKTAGDPTTNPNGYTFDTQYNYSSMQGVRGFLGVRYAFQ